MGEQGRVALDFGGGRLRTVAGKRVGWRWRGGVY